MNHVNQGWEDFKKAVLHPDAGPVQVQSMKMAFFGGASFMMGLLHQTPDDEKEADKFFEALYDELTALKDEFLKE